MAQTACALTTKRTLCHYTQYNSHHIRCFLTEFTKQNVNLLSTVDILKNLIKQYTIL